MKKTIVNSVYSLSFILYFSFILQKALHAEQKNKNAQAL